MSWNKLPAIKSDGPACATCGCGAHNHMEMDALLAVGFGDCSVTKDGEHVWSEQEADHKAKMAGTDALYWEGKDAEEAAAKDPDHDWRVRFFAPLYEAEYQRHGEGHWVLVSKGMGFA